MRLQFDWNPDKARKNLNKHGISFNEAATVFGDPLSITFPDPDHSIGEHRYLTVGLSNQGKFLIVSHTDRDDAVQVISARKTTRHERRFYEED